MQVFVLHKKKKKNIRKNVCLFKNIAYTNLFGIRYTRCLYANITSCVNPRYLHVYYSIFRGIKSKDPRPVETFALPRRFRCQNV